MNGSLATAAVRTAGSIALVLCSASLVFAADTYDLTFSGDASFQGAHGGQTVHVAVVQADSGEVVAEKSGTVSASDDPAFSLTFSDALQADKNYEVAYWMDSNFGGGSEGTCDPKKQDHQWLVDIGSASEDMTHTEKHRPGDTEAVCDMFSGM